MGMLALDRSPDEDIVIGPPGPDRITVRVIRVQGHRVRIGIDAPDNVAVHRKEVAGWFTSFHELIARIPEALGR